MRLKKIINLFNFKFLKELSTPFNMENLKLILAVFIINEEHYIISIF